MNHIVSKKVWIIGGAIVAEIVLLLIAFRIGVLVGYHKAQFSFEWGQRRYNEVAHMHSGRGMGGTFANWFGHEFMQAHGVSGTVISSSDTQLVVRDDDGNDKTVSMTTSTPVRGDQNATSTARINPNDNVLVVGSPASDGTIKATLVQIIRRAQ